MSEMFDRIAKAIASVEIGYSIKLVKLNGSEATYELKYAVGDETLEFSSQHDAYTDYYERLQRERAVAAIEALREPTEDMLIGAREWSRVFVGSPIGDKAARGCFQSMINEVLK